MEPKEPEEPGYGSELVPQLILQWVESNPLLLSE